MILITGVAGFIGSNTAEYFINKGYEILGIDNLYSGRYENLSEIISNKNFKFFKIDVLDDDSLSEIFKKYDIRYIIHLASIVSVEESMRNPKLVTKVNVEGTLNILEFARRFDVDKVIIASSASVYGEQEKIPIKESFTLKPKSIYAATNVMKEYYAKIYYENYSLRCICLRYFNVYGKKQDPRNPYSGVITRFIYKAMKNEALEIYGDGMQTRDFIHIYDVVKANFLAMNTSKRFGIYNIGTGRSVRILDLVGILEKILGKKLKTIFLPERKGDIRYSQADISLAKKELKFKPEIDLEEGLKLTVDWFMSRYEDSNIRF